MLLDSNVLIGCGAMLELHLVDILVGAPGCPLLGTRILICRAQCGCRRLGHHETGIAQENPISATDQKIQYLLVMALELFASELSAMELSAMELSAMLVLSVIMLVNIPAALS